MEDKLVLLILAGVASFASGLALLIVGWLWARINDVDRRTTENAVAIGRAVDEGRVRDILDGSLLDLKNTMSSMDKKLNQLIMSLLNNKQNSGD